MSSVHRVLRVITRLNIGGPARQALMLTKDLEPAFSTTLVAGTPQEGEGELSEAEVDVTRIPLVRPLSLRNDLHAYRALRMLLDVPLDLVHTHMAKAGALARRAALRSRHRPALVHTFHGHVLDGYFSRTVARGFIELERRLARRTDALVAVSDEVRDDLLRLGIGAPEQWRVIPLGFDLDPLLSITGPFGHLREHLNLGSDVPLIGVLGRLAPIKDHETLVRAVASLDGVHLAVFGDGELRDQLVDLIARQGVSDRIHILGWWMDLPSAYSDLDLVALTSRNEGTPVSLIEALAAGKPVVTTDVGGVRSVVDDGQTGAVVPAGDQAAVAANIDSLLRDPSRRKQMGELGRARVAVRFNKERLIGDIKELYRSLLG